MALDHSFLRIFRALNPPKFEAVLWRWASGMVGALGGTIAVDGKTVAARPWAAKWPFTWSAPSRRNWARC